MHEHAIVYVIERLGGHHHVRPLSLLIGYTVFNTAGFDGAAPGTRRAAIAGCIARRAPLTPAVVGGGFLYSASLTAWLLTLGKYPVTTVYPVFVGASFIGIALGGWLVLDE